MNVFTSTENKQLLWDILINNNVFKEIPAENFERVKVFFEEKIIYVNENNIKNITKERLIEMNKEFILIIKSNITSFKKTFEQSLQNLQSDLDEKINVKIPEKPNFEFEEDKPIHQNKMDELLSNLVNERNNLVYHPPPPPTSPVKVENKIDMDLIYDKLKIISDNQDEIIKLLKKSI